MKQKPVNSTKIQKNNFDELRMGGSERRKQLAKSVKDLRAALGLTQQDLAVAMRKAVRTVARWESFGPQGVALYELRKFAREKSLFDLAQAFNDLLRTDIASIPTNPKTRNEPSDDEDRDTLFVDHHQEKPWVEALLYLLRADVAETHREAMPLLYVLSKIYREALAREEGRGADSAQKEASRLNELLSEEWQKYGPVEDVPNDDPPASV